MKDFKGSKVCYTDGMIHRNTREKLRHTFRFLARYSQGILVLLMILLLSGAGVSFAHFVRSTGSPGWGYGYGYGYGLGYGTNDGSYRQCTEDPVWTNYTTSNSDLPDNDIDTIFQDSDGDMWFGMTIPTTTSAGVVKFDVSADSWTIYNTGNSDLPHNDVRGITEDSDGNMWFGTFGGGLAKLDTGGTWTTYNTGNSDLSSDNIEAVDIAGSGSGDLWIATHSGGIARFDRTSTWTVYNGANSALLSDDRYYDVLVASDATIWVGSYVNNAAQFSGGTWTVVDPFDGNGSITNDISEDADGHIWFFGYYASEYNGSTFTIYDPTSDPLPGNARSGGEGDYERIYMGTASAGVGILYPDDSWVIYDTGNSDIIGDNVQTIWEDNTNDDIWFGTGDGISRLSPPDCDQYLYGYGYGYLAEDPSVTTDAATSVDTTSGTLNGEITSIGSAAVTTRGFEYGTTSGSYTVTTTETGSFGAETFSTDLSGLTCNTTYYYRAYGTNVDGTGYGSELDFTTSTCPIVSTPPGGGSILPPFCSIDAVPRQLVNGGTTNVQWKSRYATEGTITPIIGAVPAIGNETVTINGTTTFTGEFKNNQGKVVECSVTVQVLNASVLQVDPNARPLSLLNSQLVSRPQNNLNPALLGATKPTGGSELSLPPGGTSAANTNGTTPNNTRPLGVIRDFFTPGGVGHSFLTSAFGRPFAIPENFDATNAAQAVGLVGWAVGMLLRLWREWNSILALFGYRRKYHPWGTVYNSVTKQPLDPAYVVLRDIQGNEVATAITDLDGRYSFLVDSGEYTIEANKTGYQFPSRKLAGRNRDVLYNNLYFGEPVSVDDGKVLARDIPLDPEGEITDWNEEEKRRSRVHSFFSRFDVWLVFLINVLFAVGFGFAMYAFVVNPVLYNTIVLISYIVISILYLFGHSPKSTGFVARKDGTPIPHAVIKIFQANTNQEILHKVTDEEGRFYLLVPRGEYYMTVEIPTGPETYENVYSSKTFKVKSGVINKKIRI